MVTIKDVAKRCGYSICTVPHALPGKGYLKEETKQRILETVTKLGYRPNTLVVNLKAGRHQALVLVLPSLTNICYIKLERYLKACVTEKGYIIYLNNTEYSLEEEEQILGNLVGMNIAGVVITPAASQHDHIMNPTKCDIPYVYLNCPFEDDIEYYLCLNDKKATYEAASYMIKLGHKNISGIFQSFGNLTYRDHYDGMAQILKKHGLDCRPSHMPFDINPEDMGITPGQTLQLLQEPDRPEVILTCNGMTALNIYRACYILGLRILDHLPVFGYDDCTMANFMIPSLSMVSIPVRRLAGTAIDLIHGCLEPGVQIELPILKASLVIHNSICDLSLD